MISDDDYMSDEELDLSYEDVIRTREISEFIQRMCKGTELFQYLVEDDLYDFLYPQEEESEN
jgi:hypothetical protein